LCRRLFLTEIEKAYAAGQLHFDGELEQLLDPLAFQQHLQPARRAEWVVHAKPSFGSPSHVIDYLGRYTHRVAISNQRLLAMDNQQVTFQYKNYRSSQPQRRRQMSLPAGEFIRRFLLHVIPAGFQRIRHYGLCSNRYRTENLARCRAVLVGARPELLPTHPQMKEIQATIIETAARCPRCKVGWMARVLTIPAMRFLAATPIAVPDTS